jgi:hypothetical protein
VISIIWKVRSRTVVPSVCCCLHLGMADIDEIIGILSSLCKVSSKEILQDSTPGGQGSDSVVYGMEGAEIRKVPNSYDIYRETSLPRVFMTSGIYKIGWVLNDAVAECMICAEPFTFLITRHHCRSCGCLACDECCTQRVKILQLPGRKCRVCDLCGVKHVDGEEWDLNDDRRNEAQIPPEETKNLSSGEEKEGIGEGNPTTDLFSDV